MIAGPHYSMWHYVSSDLVYQREPTSAWSIRELRSYFTGIHSRTLRGVDDTDPGGDAREEGRESPRDLEPLGELLPMRFS